MRASLLLALGIARNSSRLGGGRTERLRQIQMADRARTRGADRAGSRQACVGQRTCRTAVNGDHRSPWARPRKPNCRRRPSARPRKAPLPASPVSSAPKAGLYTISLSAGGWVDVVQDGHLLKPKAFSGATDCDGIRKTMKYELSASPFVLQISGARRGFDIDSDSAVGIGQRDLYPDFQPVIVFARDVRTDRKSSGSTERRFRLSHSTTTNA